jgi:hypothetical protein
LATEIHLDISSQIRKQWSSLHQVPLVYRENSIESELQCVSFLVEVDVILVLYLWKDVMNLLEVLDPFNRSRCMIYLGPIVGGHRQ